MISDIDLDHVAVALEHQSDAWPIYGGDLAGEWVGGGPTVGFASAQVRYANGMKVEVLEPYRVELNDFLRRFLDRSGPGTHHLTYKVADIATALSVAETAGYHPVGVDLSHPFWKEAFLHPKDAPGIVIQLAQSFGGDWEEPTPGWFPRPRTPEPAALVHIAHAVASIEDGERLFVDLLAGERLGSGEAEGMEWADIAWRGPGRVRLLSGAAMRDWLGDRSGRVHHLAFTCADPDGMPNARPVTDGTFEVAPEHNFGVRLMLSAV